MSIILKGRHKDKGYRNSHPLSTVGRNISKSRSNSVRRCSICRSSSWHHKMRQLSDPQCSHVGSRRFILRGRNTKAERRTAPLKEDLKVVKVNVEGREPTPDGSSSV
jgi:hypothetical protein